MPTYDYRCAENGQVVEVKHSVTQKLTTWGEVCANTGMDLGSTAANVPVERLITGSHVVQSNSLKNPEPSCASGSCCAGGMCGF